MRKILAIGAGLLLLSPVVVNAQTDNSLRISPVKSEFTAQPGSTVRANILLQNPTNKPLQAQVSAKDFEAGPERNGEPKILDGGNPKFGLSNWLADANLSKVLTVPANQTIEYEAVFRVPAAAQERTYFGTVLFTDNSQTEQSQSVGSLVFITVGQPETELAIDDLKFGESDDATKKYGLFTANVANQSDGLSNPKLRLKITNDEGKIIVELNQDSDGSVLPSSSRNYTFTPPAKLPNEPLTVTVSAVDQNGTTADKSIQLNDVLGNQAITNNVQKKTFPWLNLLGGVVLLASIIGAVMYIKNRKLKHQEPITTQPPDSPSLENVDTHPDIKL
ncbi:hypothetical protein H0X10_02320 [Candidatus Saccharibacteria bacterium]|nr:hypothetical protein [Candidatus Saccharibacteria bacterium]